MSLTQPAVMAMLDELLGPRDPVVVRREREAANCKALGLFFEGGELPPPEVKTKGCPDCKGTMYQTTDDDGKQWICQNVKCGKIEVVK